METRYEQTMIVNSDHYQITNAGLVMSTLILQILNPLLFMAHKSILFVCLGNICRSVTSEYGTMIHILLLPTLVLRAILAERGEDSLWRIDSCGTIGYHVGDSPDNRAVCVFPSQRAPHLRLKPAESSWARKCRPTIIVQERLPRTISTPSITSFAWTRQILLM